MLNSIGVLSGQPLIENVIVAVPWAGYGAGAETVYLAVGTETMPRAMRPLLRTGPTTSSMYVTAPAAQAVVLSSSGLFQYTTGTPLTVPVALSTELPAGTCCATRRVMLRV